jgi:hypothetical protein
MGILNRNAVRCLHGPRNDSTQNRQVRRVNVLNRTAKRLRLGSLENASLCNEARRRTGLEDFGDREIERRLFVLTASIEREANLHLLGRFLARMHLRDILETRLELIDLWNKSSGQREYPIERPIFITGMPRSGSTFLHELLMQDPNHRAPLAWEVMFPVRPRGGNATDRRIQKAEAHLWWFRRIAPAADAVHPMRARTPHECVTIHSYTLLSQEFATIFYIPSYSAFLDAGDLTPAYAWQKRFLQHLQKGASIRRWVLKAPDHVFSLEALFAVFPDATIIQMHRNPMEVLRSSLQLTTVLRGMFAHPQNKDEGAAVEARVLAEGLDRISRFRDSHPELAERFVDVNYSELTFDPLATVERVYAQLDLCFTTDIAERFRRLAFTRSRYSHPRQHPTLSDLGLSPGVEARRFERYCTRFGIQQA